VWGEELQFVPCNLQVPNSPHLALPCCAPCSQSCSRLCFASPMLFDQSLARLFSDHKERSYATELLANWDIKLDVHLEALHC